MDALKFLKEKKRMCDAYITCSSGCPLHLKRADKNMLCHNYCNMNPEVAVSTVERWSAEHPIKTRQSEFMKLFPDVELEDNIIKICPCMVDAKIKDKCYSLSPCYDCRKKYWLAEVK